MKVDPAKVLFVHREGEHVYCYKEYQTFKCDRDFQVIETQPNILQGKNDYPHRYPVFRLGASYYVAYRSTNKIYKISGFQITEMAQLTNLFPYSIAPVADENALLVTDIKGKFWYRIQDDKFEQIKVNFPVALMQNNQLSDVFLHNFKGQVYAINRQTGNFYIISKQLQIWPVQEL